jgi:hypothetical protein
MLADGNSSGLESGTDEILVVPEARTVNKNGTRRWRLVVGALLAGAAGVVFVAALTYRAPSDIGTPSDADEGISLVTDPRPLPLPTECSTPKTQNCHVSECCVSFGYQCYEKNATAAFCLKTCDKADLMSKGNGSWTCAPLGLKRRGATNQENCADYGGCADAGHQCYTKDAKWASCMTSCDKSQFSCEPIGERYTPDYRDDYDEDYSKSVVVEPWVKNCSHIGDSCKETKCCAYTGYHCYEKDETWASCLSNCIPKKPNGGVSEEPVAQLGKPLSNPPAHWNVTWKPAPPGPWSCKRLSVPKVGASLVGTTLFCMTAAMDDHGKGQTEDFKLLAVQQKAQTFIFACDDWVVYSDTKKKLNPGWTEVVEFPKGAKRPNLKLWVNLGYYMNIWKSMRWKGTWSKYDWTIKLDPYTVFIPQRLRSLLVHQPVPPNGAYMENCKHTRMGFHGSMEVVSKNAFGTFLSNLESCHTELPVENGVYAHFRYYGEDKFLAWCLHKHGVGRVPSRQEVMKVPVNEKIYGLHITASCPQHTAKEIKDKRIKKWAPNCSRVKTAGMHPFKTPEAYMKCVTETMGETFVYA